VRVTQFDQIESDSLTDVGVRRSHNQDNHVIKLAADNEQWRERGHLFFVADGMGAHAVGEKASEKAVEVVPHAYAKYAADGPVVALRKAITEANESIHACGQANREFEGMGTTGSALVLRPEGAWVGHVGDSRVYRIRAGVIEQLSYDHSLVWEYARIKGIDPDKVQDIPSNVIHRCLGPEAHVSVDIEGAYPLCAGDIFLLCSDGLSGQVSDPEIGAVATTLPPTEACRFLVDLANLRGGPDNITVIIAHVTAGADPTSATEIPVVTMKSRHAPLPRWKRPPWWVICLSAGILFALAATMLQLNGFDWAGLLAFLGASGSIIAGLIGLWVHYRREQIEDNKADEEELPQPMPRIHRRAMCKVEPPLLEKLNKARTELRQQATEKKWDADWPLVEQHEKKADELFKAGDLTSAFREACRAMLPLTAALARHRNRGEDFNPRWER
jgi:protein phosphatase